MKQVVIDERAGRGMEEEDVDEENRARQTDNRRKCRRSQSVEAERASC